MHLTQTPPVPPTLRAAAGLLGVVVLVLSAGAVWAALRQEPEPRWALLTVQLPAVLAGLFALVWAKGGFRDGPGLALACVATAVLAGAVLGYFSSRTLTVLGLSMKVWAAATAVSSVGLFLVAAVSVLARRDDAQVIAVRGGVALLPACLVLVGAVLGWDQKFAGAIAGLPGVVRALIWTLGALGVAICLCIGVQLVVEAFTRCRVEESGGERSRAV